MKKLNKVELLRKHIEVLQRKIDSALLKAKKQRSGLTGTSRNWKAEAEFNTETIISLRALLAIYESEETASKTT